MTPSPRQLLADALAGADPAAATLCEGWDACDLAVHLLVRERHPLAALRHVAGRPPGRVEAALAARPYGDLVEAFRAGPPRWSPLALPGVEGLANDAEFYVHAQDVLRADRSEASDGPSIDPALRARLWSVLRRTAGLAHRRSPVGVLLVVPDGPRSVARRPRGAGGESVVLVGQPEELLLHAGGRERVAAVEVRGSAAAVAAFSGASRRM